MKLKLIHYSISIIIFIVLPPLIVTVLDISLPKSLLLDDSTIFSFAVASLGIASGVGYGFDKIYDEKLVSRIRSVFSKNEKITRLFKKFPDNNEDKLKRTQRLSNLEEQVDIGLIEKYNKLHHLREVILIAMTLSSLTFFLSVFVEGFILVAIGFFCVGFLALITFLIELYEMLKRVSWIELGEIFVPKQIKRLRKK